MNTKSSPRWSAKSSWVSEMNAFISWFTIVCCLSGPTNGTVCFFHATRNCSTDFDSTAGSGQAPQLNPFGDPDAKQRLLSNPVTAAHMQQPDFQRIFDELHREPKQLGCVCLTLLGGFAQNYFGQVHSPRKRMCLYLNVSHLCGDGGLQVCC